MRSDPAEVQWLSYLVTRPPTYSYVLVCIHLAEDAKESSCERLIERATPSIGRSAKAIVQFDAHKCGRPGAF